MTLPPFAGLQSDASDVYSTCQKKLKKHDFLTESVASSGGQKYGLIARSWFSGVALRLRRTYQLWLCCDIRRSNS